MNLQTLLTFTTLGLAAAESSVVSLFIFDADPQALVGSVVASKSDTTTYSINCASGESPENCGFAAGFMYTAAPTTVDWMLAPPYDIDGHVGCSMGGTTAAVCTLTMPHQVIGSSRTELTQVTTLSKNDITFMPVTITAGPLATTTSQASGASSSASTSTGGLPQITANPGAILGGAAAALVAAVL
ncbi:hypothetical protein N7474_007592 [Penicillium riverlandense]|uniref:uncharacterized protein n=1 Tax=Penicillium riverlandense TaxID=1903569 RepID=UPI00254989E1|nr:uncharacterized protein N7474_007592 [Penicillium riverlandense]KAJ5811291.1 hypothetical protein N7474_007592 [Penicillium riverlandense]